MTDQEPQDPLSDPIVDPLFDHAPVQECSPELARQIAGKLASSLTPVKPMPSAAVLALRVALVFAALAAGLTWMMGVSAFRSLTMLQALGIGAVLAAGVALFSVGLAWQMRPGSFQRIPAKLSWAIFGAAFVAGAALLLPLRGSEAFVLDGWPCLVTGLAAAAGSAIFFWWMARSGVAVSAGSFGGMLGAMAGLLKCSSAILLPGLLTAFN